MASLDKTYPVMLRPCAADYGYRSVDYVGYEPECLVELLIRGSV